MSKLEKFLSLFSDVNPGEAKGIILLSLNGFLVLVAYYILKTLRESLILTEFNAEIKSYAIAAVAIILFFIVPIYGVVFRGLNRTWLVVWINIFFIVNLIAFYLLSKAGVSIGFYYYVWVGIFGVMVIAQFWAYVTYIYNLRSGQRIFPIVMIGVSLGALAGAKFSELLFPQLGTFGLMAVAGVLLTITIFLYRPARLATPDEYRCLECEIARPRFMGLFGGFAVVLNDQYLRLIAVFVVLLNWINSTGEYILSEMVVSWADEQVATGVTMLSREILIATFYGNFYFWVALVGLITQAFLVSKIIRFLGIPKSLLLLPVVAAVGYAFILFIPIFSIIRTVKITENATDYSLMNTIRQALFLPTSREAKFEGKTAIDTFFWRFGDLVQGGAIYVGIYWWNLDTHHFVIGNLILVGFWLLITLLIAKEYKRVVIENTVRTPPVLNIPLIDRRVEHGQEFCFSLPANTFVDTDKIGAVSLSAVMENDHPLPPWLQFKPKTRTFCGRLPGEVELINIKVKASDINGLSAFDCFRIFHS